eukprot:5015302-Pleurochrysis_carterae.AAC.1
MRAPLRSRVSRSSRMSASPLHQRCRKQKQRSCLTSSNAYAISRHISRESMLRPRAGLIRARSRDVRRARRSDSSAADAWAEAVTRPSRRPSVSGARGLSGALSGVLRGLSPRTLMKPAVQSSTRDDWTVGCTYTEWTKIGGEEVRDLTEATGRVQERRGGERQGVEGVGVDRGGGQGRHGREEREEESDGGGEQGIKRCQCQPPAPAAHVE